MQLKWFVDRDLLPNDGSEEIILKIAEALLKDETAEIEIFPDVHYKKGSRVTNGLLIKSEKWLYPACFGVENCGFTFGVINDNANLESMVEAGKELSENKFCKPKYSGDDVLTFFEEQLAIDYVENELTYSHLGFDDLKSVILKAENFIKRNNLLELATEKLCTLGSGNHFFELHKIVSSECGDFDSEYLVMVHSDSIDIGDYIYRCYSNQSDFDFFPFITRRYLKLRYRPEQMLHMFRNGLLNGNLREIINLCYSDDDYRAISINSEVGKAILFGHRIAAAFGEINRRELIRSFERISKESVKILGSHSHDSLTIESYNGKKCVVHRNGVQRIGRDSYYILPQAMGVGVMVMSNTKNADAYLSANHGTGRLQDKHVARNMYNALETERELEIHNVVLYKGNGVKLSEQNHMAFKPINSVSEQMEKYGLGHPTANTRPIFVIKE